MPLNANVPNRTADSAERLEQGLLAVLSEVRDAEQGIDVVTGGQVYAVVATGGAVRVLLDPERFPNVASQSALAETIQPLLEGFPGVERVVVKPRPQTIALRSELPGIGRVLGVHSGKGGVGKSTVAVNLALALVARGLKVGLLDADVYGPSAPILLGLTGRLETTADGARIRPRERYGLKVVSLGLLLPATQALIWRGSLVDTGLAQLFADVDWGELDLLLIDLPPGTSDVHLEVARQAPLAGIVAVTAPGQVSVDDVRRGMEMFADLAVPCLGIVENMTGLVCRRCGSESTLFGSGGGPGLAELSGLPLLVRLPFDPALAAASDSGCPPVAEAPDSAQSARFHALASVVAARLKLEAGLGT
jgi:ATP-binding protein involved in chromosome partitioning